MNEDELYEDELDDELTRMIGGPQGDEDEHKEKRGKAAKQPKVKFKMGEQVMYRRRVATVMFGPYERASKTMYELRMDDGTVVSANAQVIGKIKSIA